MTFFYSSVVAAMAVVAVNAATPLIDFQCDPCIQRSNFQVKAIVHGTKSDPFWQQVQAAAVQAGKDMKVNFEMELYDKLDLNQMASDISSVATSSNKPNALLVSIPSDTVGDAVKQVVDAQIPVVGFNTGAALAKTLDVMDFVGPDDFKGGQLAGEAMIELKGGTNSSSNIQQALFINDEPGNQAMADRLQGFQAALGDSVLVDTLEVDGTDASAMSSAISSKLSGCGYQAVLLSGTRSLDSAIAAYLANSCSISNSPMGAFDTSLKIYDAIGRDQLSFTISNNQYLQGALSTVLASLVATTGKSLAASADNDNGAYLPGPIVVKKSNLPSDTQKVCEDSAFPVCPNTKAPNGEVSACACTDRSKIKIGGVTHGITTDSFWDPVFAASRQAAFDMGVTLLNDRFEPEEDEGVLHQKMGNKMEKLCTQDDVDGLFVSIPSDTPVDAINACLRFNKPVMSINAGADMSQELGLNHHIGMMEVNAGYAAGEFLIKSGINRAICINHAQGVNVVEERCSGFQNALEKAGVTYLGQVYVPDDNQPIYVQTVEEFVNEEGDWDGMGILAAGSPQHIPVIEVQARHPGSKVGSFDVSLELYDAVDAGVKEFGMDQEAYLQGYMPVILLTYAATTKQTVLNRVIESGPAFVESSPSEAQQICEDHMFETCAEEDDQASSASKSSSNNDSTKTVIIVVVVIAVVLLAAMAYTVSRINALNKHVEELKSQGKTVPDLSMSQKMSSLVKPPGQVVVDVV